MTFQSHIIILLSVLSCTTYGQSLLDQLNEDNAQKKDTVFTEATFKSTRFIGGQSVETAGKYALNVLISHRFGNINSGVHQFYGFDQSSIRLGLEYGITNRLDIGIGRSREQELVDGYFKIKLLRQATGAYNMPISISVYSSIQVKAEKWRHPQLPFTFTNRLSYVNEFIFARKFSERFSLQVVPGYVHRNLTDSVEDKNVVPYTGMGCRMKITKRISINVEYYWIYPDMFSHKVYNPLAIGFDIETGGHIFQLHFSNSRGMQEKIMITENHNKWSHGDFGFGFNIIRLFNLKRK
jgi:hypothetical protein